MRANNNLSTLVICNNSQIMVPWRFCSFCWKSHSQYFNNVWHFWSSLSRLTTKSGQSCSTALKWRSSNGRIVIFQVFKVKVEEEMSWGDFSDQRNLFPSSNDFKCRSPRADWLWVCTPEPVPADFISSLASLRGRFNYSILNQLRYNASMSS